jgi:SAM-dependent methyltransferase
MNLSTLVRWSNAPLAVPWVYKSLQRSLRGNNTFSVYVNEYVRPSAGDRILDIGCGPADIVAHFPPVDYVGFDLNPAYIKAAQARYGSRGRFEQGRVSTASIDHPASYDLVLATAILHHLDDAEALDLFRLARAALKPGGRLVTLDGCYEKGQARLAALLLWLDRGRFVRTRDAYISLASQVFTRVVAHIRHDLLRVAYTHIILECEP